MPSPAGARGPLTRTLRQCLLPMPRHSGTAGRADRGALPDKLGAPPEGERSGAQRREDPPAPTREGAGVEEVAQLGSEGAELLHKRLGVLACKGRKVQEERPVWAPGGGGAECLHKSPGYSPATGLECVTALRHRLQMLLTRHRGHARQHRLGCVQVLGPRVAVQLVLQRVLDLRLELLGDVVPAMEMDYAVF